MSRALLALCALLAVGGLAVFILLPGGEEPPLDPLDASPAEVEEEDRGPAEVEVATQPTVTPELEAAPTQRDEIEAVEAAASVKEFETYEGEDGAIVRVIDDETGEPIPGAEVLLVLRNEIEEEALEVALTAGASNLRAILVEYGHRYRANAEGEARVLPISDYPIIMAYTEDMSGFAWQDGPGAREIEVRMKPLLKVHVTVVDQQGVPVPHAPVALQMRDERFSFTLFTRDADEQGELLLDDLQPFLESGGGPGNAQLAIVAHAMQTDTEGDGPHVVMIDDEVLAAAEAQLVLPPTGQVQVKVVQADGKPFLDNGIVMLRHAGEQSGFGMSNEGGLVRQVVDGVAHFRHIALGGQELVAEFRRMGTPTSEIVSLNGPTQAGEVVEAEIQRAARPKLSLRLVDEEGQPITEALVEIELAVATSEEESSDYWSRRSDDAGRIEFEIDPLPAERSTLSSRRLLLEIDTPGIGKSGTQVDLSQPFAPGAHDLGDVVLTSSPVLVQGQLVDPAGNPVARARVNLMRANVWNDEFHGWRHTEVDAMTDAEGRFRLQGEKPEGERFAVQVWSEEYQQLEEEVQLYGPEQQFILQLATHFLGTMRFDSSASISNIQIYFLNEAEDRQWVSMSQRDEVAEFEAQVEPGVAYTFIAETSAGEELLRIPGLVATASSDNRPHALQDIDLRGLLRTIVLRVEGPDGKPLDATVVVKSEQSSWHSYTAHQGKMELPVVKALPEVTVQHPAHAPRTLKELSSDQTIRLERAMEVSVILPTEYLAIEGVELAVLLTPTENHDHSLYASRRRVEFDAQGRATAYAPVPGNYRADLSVGVRKENHHSSTTIHAGDFHIGSSGMVITLSIDRERFDRAVASMQEQG